MSNLEKLKKSAELVSYSEYIGRIESRVNGLRSGAVGERISIILDVGGHKINLTERHSTSKNMYDTQYKNGLQLCLTGLVKFLKAESDAAQAEAKKLLAKVDI